ncbi:hypothetical protein ACFX14_003685 [Malus domestica]
MEVLVEFIRDPNTSLLEAMKSNDDNKSMFQYLELHRKFVVDLYSSNALTFIVLFLVKDNIYGEKVEANEDENESGNGDIIVDENRVHVDVGVGENRCSHLLMMRTRVG